MIMPTTAEELAGVMRAAHPRWAHEPVPSAVVPTVVSTVVSDVEAIRRAVTCPYCHAAPGERCRTMNGSPTGRFGTRANHHRREVAYRRRLSRRAVIRVGDQIRIVPGGVWRTVAAVHETYVVIDGLGSYRRRWLALDMGTGAVEWRRP
jgi:hypothetical protein